MKKDISQFISQTTRSFFEGVGNLIVFFPYFFSVSTLLKTLFYPWKNIITKKQSRGFSLSEWANRMFLNVISSSIGAMMRLSIISFFLIFFLFFLLLLPFGVFFFFVIILPIKIVLFFIQPTEEQRFQKEQSRFLSSHCLKQENFAVVTSWFNAIWSKGNKHKKWWSKSNLFTYPPLARDWAFGYTPTLDSFTEDLSSPSYQQDIRHIVGRTQELTQIEQTLSKTGEANIILVGEEGVGKHTVIDAFARLVYEGRINTDLSYKRILKLNMEKILTAYTDPKQRERFLEDLFAEAVEAKNIVFIIENMDKYVAYGPDRVDLSIPIEKFARRPTIQFIGITTPFFYQRFIFSNEKIQRLFAKVDVPEVSSQQALQMVLGIIPDYEKTYNVIIPYETALCVVDKSEFYITYIPFPEKAIDLLDATCSYSSTQRRTKSVVVSPETVDIVLTQKTHIPTQLTNEMKTKLLNLETELNKRVLYQQDAVSKLSAALRRSFILLGKRKKPLATFLFLGPTGVGKTETAKALSLLFFGGEKYLTRFDMSLYQTKEDIKNLIGSMESGLPGLLSKAIREQPFCVLLLDELEKAHPDLLNIFLTVIDEGYFTDGFGKRVDCKNLIVIATSNAGADFMYKQQQIMSTLKSHSFIASSNKSSPDRTDSPSSPVVNNDNTSELIDYLIQNHIYSPEFLNRFDGVVMYNPISQDTVLILARKMVGSIQSTIYKLYKINLSVSDTTLAALIKGGFNSQFGARNLEHVVTQQIEDKIAKQILEGSVKEGDTIEL